MRISGGLPVLALVGVLAGCGGQAATGAPAPTAAASEASSAAAGDAAAIVRKAAERVATESHRYRLEITEADGPITGEGEYVPGPPIRVRESFSFADPEFGPQTFERIAVGADQWFRAALGGAGADSADEKWLNAPAFGGGANERLGPYDVREQLPLLLASSDVRPDGEATIDGVRTARYRVTATAGSEPTSLEVWIDSDGRIRRFVQSSVGATGVSLAEVNFRDFGAAVEVSAPPADQIAAPPSAPPS